MPTTRPARQLCPLCVHEDEVTVEFIDDEWVMACESQRHMPIEWRPREQYQNSRTGRSGLGEELGVYEDLLACVHGRSVEYGIVEYRYSERNPETYKALVVRYGHKALAPTKYSASVFLSRALGQLWREGLIAGFWAPATGYWRYNGVTGAYGDKGTPQSDGYISWAEFAVSNLGVPAGDWPPLAYRASEE